jgi:hypothetical protein
MEMERQREKEKQIEDQSNLLLIEGGKTLKKEGKKPFMHYRTCCFEPSFSPPCVML